MNCTPHRCSFSVATVGVSLVTLLLLAPAVAQAQAAEFFACYVKGSGVVYRVNPPASPGEDPKLKDQCGEKHTPFWWTDGMNAIRIGDAAGGDLAGTYPDPTVAKLQGRDVSATAPSTSGDVLTWSGSAWEPQTPASGFSGDHADLTNVLFDQHHTPYTDTEAVAAMGALEDANALNHDRYTDAEAVAAVGAGGGVTDHGTLDAPSLLDDDHPQYLLTDGVRGTTNGFAVTGTRNVGTIPTSGAGVRLMWYAGKAALRAGEVSGTEWDNANVGLWSTAMGALTTAGGEGSTAMGIETTASGIASTAMGLQTLASGINSTAMGVGTLASGLNSTAMGFRTTASGGGSTVMGSFASTNNQIGAFVYGDASSPIVNAPGPNSFTVRARGGTIFWSNAAANVGVKLLGGGGAWLTVSDRNSKENFLDEDGEQVLSAIASMPIQSWNYRAQDPSIRHLGPMAQDFRAAFGLGVDDKHINTTDIDGINMMAVQALEKRTRDLQAENEHLRAMIAGLDAALQRLEAAMERAQR